MEATITMSLSDYKEMEDKIETLEKMLKAQDEDMDRTAQILIDLYPNLFTDELIEQIRSYKLNKPI